MRLLGGALSGARPSRHRLPLPACPNAYSSRGIPSDVPHAIFPVSVRSSFVTLVSGSRTPCSSSTSSPRRNCSRSTLVQSSRSVVPTCLASSPLIRRLLATACLLPMGLAETTYQSIPFLFWPAPSLSLFRTVISFSAFFSPLVCSWYCAHL